MSKKALVKKSKRKEKEKELKLTDENTKVVHAKNQQQSSKEVHQITLKGTVTQLRQQRDRFQAKYDKCLAELKRYSELARNISLPMDRLRYYVIQTEKMSEKCSFYWEGINKLTKVLQPK